MFAQCVHIAYIYVMGSAVLTSNRIDTMTHQADLTYIAERLGSEATTDDAQAVAALAEQLAAEQGDAEFDLIDWLGNRTYEWTRLWEAAQGDASALAEVRAEAHLPALT